MAHKSQTAKLFMLGLSPGLVHALQALPLSHITAHSLSDLRKSVHAGSSHVKLQTKESEYSYFQPYFNRSVIKWTWHKLKKQKNLVIQVIGWNSHLIGSSQAPNGNLPNSRPPTSPPTRASISKQGENILLYLAKSRNKHYIVNSRPARTIQTLPWWWWSWGDVRGRIVKLFRRQWL